MEVTKKEKNEIWEWSKATFIAIGFVFIIRYFLFTPIIVDGESMEPTLADSERMIVNKFQYEVWQPNRFDIIVFHASKEKDYIKRVIGLPGEHIAYKNDQLYINGQLQDEPYLESLKEELIEGEGPLTEDFTLEERTKMKVIPEGYLFVMGDNRRFSQDSRLIGLISMNEVVGNTGIKFWPLNEMGLVD